MFKAYDNKNKKWLDSFMITPNGMVVIRQKQGGWMNFNDVIVDATLCRGTGLKDKNGVEIFEGDILIFRTPNFTINRRVEYSNESASFVLYKIPFDKRFMHNEPIKQDYLIDYSAEIIGNIFDTPHLLEAK